jgi:hypothetical protein
MAVYARSVAAELEARFHAGRTTLYDRGLQVTASPPPCFESRQSCGNAVHWHFELRTHRALDAQVAGIATGRGALTIRPITGVTASTCPHQAQPYSGASISQPFVPQSFASVHCLSLGPAIRTIVGATAQEDTVISSTVPSTVRVALEPADAAALATWAETHQGTQVSLLLDDWIIARIPAQTIIDAWRATVSARKSGVDRPTELTTVGVHEGMDGAIALAINTAAQSSPLFEDPVPSH